MWIKCVISYLGRVPSYFFILKHDFYWIGSTKQENNPSYARAVDSTILTALSSLTTEQAKPTQKMVEKVKQLLDYCASQEEAIITYNKSKMIFVIHSDEGYCNKKKLRS